MDEHKRIKELNGGHRIVHKYGQIPWPQKNYPRGRGETISPENSSSFLLILDSILRSSYDLVDDDLRGVEAEPRLGGAGAEPCRAAGEGPESSRRRRRGVVVEACGGGLPVRGRGLGALAARRRGRGGRLVVHARRLRAVRVEPRRDAHAHVQHLHVPGHLQLS